MTYQAKCNETPFNEDFCTSLEYRIGETFGNSERLDLRGFWCDGVSSNPVPNTQRNKKSVNDTRRIVTKAWIGKNGQDEYEMTIHFGGHALRRYAIGTELVDCIPSAESMDWIDIYTEIKRIEIKLE